MTEGYVSTCAAHYYRQLFDGLNGDSLREQRRQLEDALLAISQERAELAGLGGRREAKLLRHLSREADELVAKLAAVRQLEVEMK